MRLLFSRRWFQLTVIVMAALAILVNLGFWQLERLAQRRYFNNRVLAQINRSPLELTAAALQDAALAAELGKMEYRPVIVTGEYDFSNQVGLRNQAYHLNLGGHLLTPLRIAGAPAAVMIDRGWIPQADLLTGRWERFSASQGQVEVRGVIRLSQSKPDIGRMGDDIPAPGEPPLRFWRLANVEAIAGQLPYPLLPIYIQQSPDPLAPPPTVVEEASMTAPYPESPDVDLTEGNHQSYAMQWFTFALILTIGYPIYVHRQEHSPY